MLSINIYMCISIYIYILEHTRLSAELYFYVFFSYNPIANFAQSTLSN